MSWEELNQDNIEEVKQHYYEYLEDNKADCYKSNLLTFEEFINQELRRCERCGTIMINNQDFCFNCYDEMYKI